MSFRMPALFIGHGNPMNAVEDNRYSKAWIDLGKRLPRPEAILSISAHWFTEGSFVSEEENPRTMHDFYGFPEELYEIDYSCPGAPEVAREIERLVSTAMVENNSKWGLDHGTWVPFVRIFPNADIPTVQLSIDMSQPSEFHYEIGRELAVLRDRGVLLIGSGNIVHNLGRMDFDPEAEPYDWSTEFDQKVKKLVEKGDHRSLVQYEEQGSAALLSIPTPDHYWPLLYILGAIDNGDSITYPIDGIAHGSVSMRSIAFGL